MGKFKYLGVLALSSLLLLSACDEGENDSPRELEMDKGKYELVWYEVVNNGFTDKVIYNISYINNGKQEYANIQANKIIEHILHNPEAQPYIERKGGTLHVYRQPINVTAPMVVKGKVENKEVKGDE